MAKKKDREASLRKQRYFFLLIKTTLVLKKTICCVKKNTPVLKVCRPCGGEKGPRNFRDRTVGERNEVATPSII